jgi:GntR family transcriptional regulator
MQKNPLEPQAGVNIDSDLKVPLYHQIFLILAAKITDGAYENGQALPSEQEVAASYGVSRITATRAFRELADAGLVVRGRGRGTRVNYEGGRTVVRGGIQGLAESRRINIMTGSPRMLSFDYVNAPRDVAAALGMPVGTVVQKAVRVMESGGLPFSHLTTYVPAELGQKWTRSDLESHSLLALLEGAGATLERGEQRISAVLADNQMAQLLSVPVGSPLLSVVRTTFTTGDEPIEHLIAFYPPDRYQIHMTLDRDDSAHELMTTPVAPAKRRRKRV